MPRLQSKSFATPDQVRTFPSGRVEIILLDEIAVGRMRLRPGWRWSQDVQPVVGGRSCPNRHVGYAISGTLRVTMDDGTELVIRSGDGYEIPPGVVDARTQGRRTGRPGRQRRINRETSAGQSGRQGR